MGCVGVVKAVSRWWNGENRHPERERQIDGKGGRGAGGDEFGVELSANEGTEAGGRG